MCNKLSKCKLFGNAYVNEMDMQGEKSNVHYHNVSLKYKKLIISTYFCVARKKLYCESEEPHKKNKCFLYLLQKAQKICNLYRTCIFS